MSPSSRQSARRSARYRALGVAVVLAVGLTACGAQTSGESPPPTSTTTGTTSPSTGLPAPGAVGLVGLWGLRDARGLDEHDAVLRLAPGELSLWRSCGVSFGGWRAGGGLLLLDPGQSATGSCATPTGGSADPSSSWLSAVTRYERDGSGWRLLDRSGAVVVRLVAGGTVSPRPDVDASLTESPVLDAAGRAALAEPVALPSGLRPAARVNVLGRWRLADPPTRQSGKPPFLSVATDGTWTGFDGCNTTAGRWLVGDGGRLLTTSGPSTLIGCEGFDMARVWGTAARVGLDQGLLVLVDRDGHEIVRLQGPDVVASMSHGPVQR